MIFLAEIAAQTAGKQPQTGAGDGPEWPKEKCRDQRARNLCPQWDGRARLYDFGRGQGEGQQMGLAAGGAEHGEKHVGFRKDETGDGKRFGEVASGHGSWIRTAACGGVERAEAEETSQRRRRLC